MRLLCAAILAGFAACAAADEPPDVRGRGFRLPKIRKPHYRQPALRGRMLRASPLPAFYDIRSNGWVTAVRDQGDYGACWAFAAFGAMESAMIKAGLADAGIDLSEKNLVNLIGIAGDHGIFGGDVYTPLGYLSRGQGPVLEAEDRYPAGGKTVATFGTSPELVPSCFVRKVAILPPRADVGDNAAIKSALMEYGALFVNYFSGMENDAAGTSCIVNTWYWGYANHAVTLVGWDDSFRIGSHTGAFIVKNSWGGQFGDNGYYRIAYDDVTFCTAMGAEAFVVETNGFPGTVAYQYDRTGYNCKESDCCRSNAVRVCGRGFNRYVASGDQAIVAVGFMATVEGADYTVSVSRAGEILASLSGSLSEMGYHVVSLTNEAVVTAGETFDVGLEIDIPRVEYEDDEGKTCVTLPLAKEEFEDAVDPVYGMSYAYDYDAGEFVRLQESERANLVLKAFARPVATARRPVLAGAAANASVSNGADVVSWLSGYAETACHGNTYGALAGVVCANGRTAVDNWCLGLDPTNAASDIVAELKFTNGAPCVTCSPATERCEYVTKGRSALDGGAGGWEPARYDGTHRFFRVEATPRTAR